MRRNWWATIGLLMVLVLSAAACGGDDGGSSGGGGGGGDEEVSQEDWVDEASDLCSDWAEEVENVDGTDPDETAELAETTTAFRDDVEGLGTPEGIEDEADAFGEALDEITDYAEGVAEAQEDGDDFSDELIEQGSEASSALVEAAEELELDCDLSVIDERADDTGDLTSDFSDDASSDFSDDFSDDFSEDFSDSEGVDFADALDPEIFIPEFGTDEELDELALDCFDGDFSACDTLYFTSPPEDSTGSYEGYGATCGGRITEERPGACQLLGDTQD